MDTKPKPKIDIKLYASSTYINLSWSSAKEVNYKKWIMTYFDYQTAYSIASNHISQKRYIRTVMGSWLNLLLFCNNCDQSFFVKDINALYMMIHNIDRKIYINFPKKSLEFLRFMYLLLFLSIIGNSNRLKRIEEEK